MPPEQPPKAYFKANVAGGVGKEDGKKMVMAHGVDFFPCVSLLSFPIEWARIMPNS